MRHHLAFAALLACLAGAFWLRPPAATADLVDPNARAAPEATSSPPPSTATTAAPPLAPAARQATTISAGSDTPPAIRRSMLPRFGQRTGPASLARLPDGRLAVAWVGAIDSENDGIWFALQHKGQWQTPVLAAMRESTAGGTYARLSELGSPLLQVEGGWLTLWYNAGVIGEGSGGSLHRSLSTDTGQTWREPRRLPAGPLPAFGPQLAAPPLPLADGGTRFAVSEAGPFGQRGLWLDYSAQGKLRQRQPAAGPLIAATRATDGTLFALRQSADQLWLDTFPPATAASLPLPAEASPATAALLALRDGRLLLAAAPRGNAGMVLWLSPDRGLSWQRKETLEAADDGAASFTHPALLEDRDGSIHLIYTWRRQGIRHQHFTPAWLGRPAGAEQ